MRNRVEQLEARAAPPAEAYEAPIEVGILLKEIEREQARKEGREPPAWTPEELESLHADDVENAAGRGVVGWLGESSGWQSEEAQETLSGWQVRASANVEKAEHLPLSEVYEND